MNCTSCGANLPQGAAQCQVCGTPTPYNIARPPSSPQYDPNVAAQQPGPGNPPQYDPTVLAQPYGGTPPSPPAAYGTPPYGTPPPPPPISYPTPSEQPYPYGAPPPQQSYYVAPQQQPGYAPQQPPKKRGRLPLILGIIAAVLIIACAGISFAVYQGLKQAGTTISSSLDATTTSIAATATSASNTNTTPTTSSNVTPTTSNSGNSPSGIPIDSTAAGIITNVKMASGVDSSFKPTTLTSTFVTKQTIYATFTIDPNAPSNGFVKDKWYSDGTFAFSSKTLAVQSDFLGYLSAEYNIATQGSVELYWCVKSDCSDARLADVASFTVTASSIHGSPPPALAFMDINRP